MGAGDERGRRWSGPGRRAPRSALGRWLDEQPLGVMAGAGVVAGAAAGAGLLAQEGAWGWAGFAGLLLAAVPLAWSGRPVVRKVKGEKIVTPPVAPPGTEEEANTGTGPGAVTPAAAVTAAVTVADTAAVTVAATAAVPATVTADVEPAAVEPLPARARSLGMVSIPAGRFWMGSDKAVDPISFDNERPRREVHLDAFEMARVPVTQRLYQEVMGDNPSQRKGDELPVTNVDWNDAIRFCNALSERDGLEPAYRTDGVRVEWLRGANGYRLPTEAEWEYAARGTDGRIYPWGNEPPSNQICWNGEGNDAGFYKRRGPSPVGSYPAGASPWGLLDMAGNVWEWCWDWYSRYQKKTEVERNPVGPQEGTARVLRGGSWVNFEPAYVRAAVRGGIAPSRRDVFAGFRCARGPNL